MTSGNGYEADWSSFKYIAPSQDVHAPLGSPSSRSPGHFFLAHASKQLSPPCSGLPGPRSTPPSAQLLGEEEKHHGFESAQGEADEEAKDARARVLEKLELDEEGNAIEGEEGQAGKANKEEEREKKYVGVGYAPDMVAEEGSLDPAQVEEKLAVPDGVPPPSPPSASLPSLSSSLKLDPDPSIPLPTRLAGRLEATVGKLKKDEKMVLDGRVREFGVEAVGLPGEVREAILSEREERFKAEEEK